MSGFTSNHFHYENIGAATSRPYGETQSFSDNSALASVMSSLSYSYDDRYSFTLTTRADGSSMVGDMHTWGFFPSVSASWNIKNEGFLKDVSAVSQMNINAGYGRSGNLGGISPFSTMELMLPGEIVPFEGSSTITLNRMRNTNPDLEWEMRSTFNVGASMGFWKNRLALTLEYYYSKTTDLLYQYDVPVPPFKYDKLLANIGSMSNSGVETGIIVTPLLKDDMELNISLVQYGIQCLPIRIRVAWRYISISMLRQVMQSATLWVSRSSSVLCGCRTNRLSLHRSGRSTQLQEQATICSSGEWVVRTSIMLIKTRSLILK